MNNIEIPRRKHSTLWISLLAVLTLLVLTGRIDQAQAQSQWTTNGNDINNTNTGHVGVGTTSVSNGKLTVQTASGTLPAITRFEQLQGTNDRGGYISFGGGASGVTGRGYIGFGKTGTGSATLFSSEIADSFSIRSEGAFHLGTFGNNIRMTINTVGNIGIGTLNPTKRLHIAGDNSETGGYPILKLENTQSGGHSWLLYSGAFGAPGALGIYDETAGAYRMFFDGSGNLGIGTANPVAKLDVRQLGNSGALATLLVSYGANEDTYLRGGSSSAVVHIGDVAATTSKLLLMENGGNVGTRHHQPH
ncbi:MAG TPA: hypothetical protein VF791_14210 [Pyrinomonadaceae bacterium]